MPVSINTAIRSNLLKEDPISHVDIKIGRNQPYLTLNDGNRMPMLGLGTWNAKGKELKEAVKVAIYCGYRHIDTATNYRNEDIVGLAVKECIEEGIIKREDIFITTKLWNNSHSRAQVPQALAKSLQNLQLSYVDLYLIHYPIGYLESEVLSPLDDYGQVITSEVDYVETWRGMEDVRRLGLAKSIGVSNFNAKQLTWILYSCNVVPAVNQVESHPYLNQGKLLQFCRDRGIELTAYSPLGSPGKLDPKLNQPCLIQDPIIDSLSKKYQRSAAQILLRYQLQRNVVVIPKATKKVHIESNFESLSFELSFDDMRELDSMDRNYRFMLFERCLNHKYYPFKEPF